MALMKNLGENDSIDSGEIDDVSYVPQEADVETPEEKSDAQLVAEGEITLNEGDVEIFVDANSVYQPPKKEVEEGEEESEEEVEEEESSEEEVKEEEEEVQEEKPAKKEVKKHASAPDPVQKRINKITREKYEALRETERLAKELAELKAAHKETKLAADKSSLEMSKPKQEEFETDEEYYTALGRWGAKMELHEQQSTQKEAVVEEEPVNPVQRIIDVGKETYPDFEDLVLREDLKITPLMVEAAADSDYASDIFYYLGQNPEYAATISQMRSPAKVAREIGRIEDKFIGEEVEEVVTQEANTEGEFPVKAKPKNKIKSPPPPVKPLGGSGKTATSLEDAGIAEYYELRGYDRSGMKKRTT